MGQLIGSFLVALGITITTIHEHSPKMNKLVHEQPKIDTLEYYSVTVQDSHLSTRSNSGPTKQTK